MGDQELKTDDRVEAVKRPEGKQTIPVGTKATVKMVHPACKGLIWIQTDTPVRALVIEVGKEKKKKEVVDVNFFVCAEEVKKIEGGSEKGAK